MNIAQEILTIIGGTASLVAGNGGHYWADNSTQKKMRTRGRTGRGRYGRDLMNYFDQKIAAERKMKKQEKRNG